LREGIPMSDIFDKLSLLFDDRDEEENKKHAEHMRDALAYLVVQTHVEETFGAYDQVFLGVQFFAELAYRLAPSREIAHSTLEMATLEGERDCYARLCDTLNFLIQSLSKNKTTF